MLPLNTWLRKHTCFRGACCCSFLLPFLGDCQRRKSGSVGEGANVDGVEDEEQSWKVKSVDRSARSGWTDTEHIERPDKIRCQCIRRYVYTSIGRGRPGRVHPIAINEHLGHPAEHRRENCKPCAVRELVSSVWASEALTEYPKALLELHTLVVRMKRRNWGAQAMSALLHYDAITTLECLSSPT